MKTEKEIKERLKHILKDERLYYQSADVFTNAPLALEQLSQETKVEILEWVLGIPYTNFIKLRKKQK